MNPRGYVFWKNRSDFLFARPSFLGGLARIFDLSGTLNFYNDSPSTEKADIRALAQDWKAVGDNLRIAYEEYRTAHEQQKQETPPATVNQKTK